MAKSKKIYAWKDPGALGKWSVVLLAITVGQQLAALGLNLIFGAAASYAPDIETFTAPQLAKWAVDMVEILLLLTSIVWGAWIWRVNSNAHVFKPSVRFSPLGAVGFYFVPFVSLFLPFQAMEEIWFVSAGKTTQTPLVMRWWWAALLLSNFLGLFALRLPPADAAPLSALGNLGSIVCCLTFIHIVRQITAMLIQLGDLPSDGDSVIERLSAG